MCEKDNTEGYVEAIKGGCADSDAFSGRFGSARPFPPSVLAQVGSAVSPSLPDPRQGGRGEGRGQMSENAALAELAHR